MATAELEKPKGRTVFRNAGQRIYYVRPRPGAATKADHVFGPGDTLEAQDDAEEQQWSTIGDLRDVRKETPALSGKLDSLQKQLDEAKAQNDALRTEKAELEKRVETVNRQATSRSKK